MSLITPACRAVGSEDASWVTVMLAKWLSSTPRRSSCAFSQRHHSLSYKAQRENDGQCGDLWAHATILGSDERQVRSGHHAILLLHGRESETEELEFGRVQNEWSSNLGDM